MYSIHTYRYIWGGARTGKQKTRIRILKTQIWKLKNMDSGRRIWKPLLTDRKLETKLKARIRKLKDVNSETKNVDLEMKNADSKAEKRRFRNKKRGFGNCCALGVVNWNRTAKSRSVRKQSNTQTWKRRGGQPARGLGKLVRAAAQSQRTRARKDVDAASCTSACLTHCSCGSQNRLRTEYKVNVYCHNT